MGYSFSVVIPTSDRLDSLREVVAGAEAQLAAPDYELIVVNDGSTKTTDEWLCAHKFTVPTTVLRQDRQGPAVARNAGVMAASGDRIAFLGDDTVPTPTWLASHARAHAERGGGEDLAIVGRTMWHHRIRVTPFLKYINESGPQFGYGLVQDGQQVTFAFFYTSNLSLSRASLIAEPFDPRFPEAVWEDIECGYRLCRAGMRLIYDAGAIVEHNHPTDLNQFCTRQERAGLSASIFYRLHPELASFLGIGEQGPPPMPRPSEHRTRLLLARVLEHFPVGWPRLWNSVLRYHYLVGLRRGWHEVIGTNANVVADAAALRHEADPVAP